MEQPTLGVGYRVIMTRFCVPMCLLLERTGRYDVMEQPTLGVGYRVIMTRFCVPVCLLLREDRSV